VREFAAAAGCSPRTFYRYFGSKEDVLFYDLSWLLDELTHKLVEGLANGAEPWSAVTDAIALVIERYDVEHERIARDRVQLWLSERVLRARYMQYIASAEQAVTDLLAGASAGAPGDRELASLRAVAAIGAYRATLSEHSADGRGESLAGHFRRACQVIGSGVARVPVADR
jgi:AcrR family transcriptional regulator